MSKKIHQELFRIAKEILEKDKTLDLQKAYDQTLSLLEQLILIKYSEELSGDLSQEFDLKLDNTIDFIKADNRENKEEAVAWHRWSSNIHSLLYSQPTRDA